MVRRGGGSDNNNKKNNVHLERAQRRPERLLLIMQTNSFSRSLCSDCRDYSLPTNVCQFKQRQAALKKI